jgi:hypothetical protein
MHAIRGGKVRRSFGTALKLFDSRSLWASGLMACALCTVTLVSPPTKDFVEIVKPPVFFALLKDRLLPKGSWFGLEVPVAPAPAELNRAAQEDIVVPPAGPVTKTEIASRPPARSAKRHTCGRSCGSHKEKRRR